VAVACPRAIPGSKRPNPIKSKKIERQDQYFETRYSLLDVIIAPPAEGETSLTRPHLLLVELAPVEKLR
jgi:hypothetical protein